MEWLKWFREEIDSIDWELIKLLAKRFEVVVKVWEYKKLNDIQPLQTNRWEEVLSSKKKIARLYNLSEKFIEDIWNRIHEEALEIEK